MKKVSKCLSTVSAELLLISGAFVFVWATARINLTLTLYLVGAMLIAAGFFVARNRG